MKQRQSSSHVKSWIFVRLVGNTEVQFSQHFIDFPLNHDHSDGKKQGQKIFLSFFPVCLQKYKQNWYTYFRGSQWFAGTKSLWVSQVMNFYFYTKWSGFVERIINIIKTVRIKILHTSPPVILAYIMDDKALYITCFKLWKGTDFNSRTWNNAYNRAIKSGYYRMPWYFVLGLKLTLNTKYPLKTKINFFIHSEIRKDWERN